MGFTNMTEPTINRKLARRHRAAQRLQNPRPTRPLFDEWDSYAQQRLETKLAEFCGLCRNGAVHYTNVPDAATNILAHVAKIMGAKNYKYWHDRFVEEGVRAASRDMR